MKVREGEEGDCLEPGVEPGISGFQIVLVLGDQ